MKIISWNINGLNSVIKKGSLKVLIENEIPDILCLQETRCSADLKTDFDFDYKLINDSKIKKGYSGTGIFAKEQPIQIHDDFTLNEEGRLICFEYPKFYLINVYVPNTKPDLSRLDYRINTWEKAVREYINKYQKIKPVIYVGDLNVAATEIDIHTVKGHEKMHGFTIEERDSFELVIKECKLIDTFRFLHPNDKKYTWFSNFANSRSRNKGWRIDYILISEKLKNKIISADILSDYLGSDHIPIVLKIDI
jgi:exodeoxyribonuclease-3